MILIESIKTFMGFFILLVSVIKYKLKLSMKLL